MVKQLLLIFLTTSSLAALAQKATTPGTKEVVVTGKLDNLPNDSVIRLIEPYTGEVDSAVIKNHSFRITHAMPKGGSVYLLGLGGMTDEKTATLAYLEDGKMEVRGAGFQNATYSGSAWVKEWQEVMVMTDPAKGDNIAFAAVQKKYDEANAIGDEDASDKYKAEMKTIQQHQLNLFRAWIKNNNNSGVSGYLLTVAVSDTAERNALYASLGEHAKASRILTRWKNPGKVDPLPYDVHTTEGTAGNIPGRPASGTLAPAFSLPDVNGKMVSLADFKGKYVLIDFWASWCGPCKGQVPFLKAANEKYKNKNFVLLGVSLDSKKEGWVKGIEKEQLNWLQVSGLKGWSDEAAHAYGIAAIPANVLVGPDGKILATDLMGEMLDKKLAELLP